MRMELAAIADQVAADQVAEPWLAKVDQVLGIESRGFIVGTRVAYRLGVGLTIARKPGKLPLPDGRREL
jgi:adenine phosphoribosyltransferase